MIKNRLISPTDFGLGRQDNSVGENRLFNKRCWDEYISKSRRMKLDPYFSPYTEINSKWITVLNIRAKNMELLKENELIFMTLS